VVEERAGLEVHHIHLFSTQYNVYTSTSATAKVLCNANERLKTGTKIRERSKYVYL